MSGINNCCSSSRLRFAALARVAKTQEGAAAAAADVPSKNPFLQIPFVTKQKFIGIDCGGFRLTHQLNDSRFSATPRKDRNVTLANEQNFIPLQNKKKINHR